MKFTGMKNYGVSKTEQIVCLKRHFFIIIIIVMFVFYLYYSTIYTEDW